MTTAFRTFIAEHVEEDTIFLGSPTGEFDSAILGVGERDGRVVIIYDVAGVIDVLGKEGMSEEDAWDWYGHNIETAYLGPHTPIYVRSLRSLGWTNVGAEHHLVEPPEMDEDEVLGVTKADPSGSTA